MTTTQHRNLTTSYLDPMTRMAQVRRRRGSLLKTLDTIIVRAQSLGPAMDAANRKGLQRPWTGTDAR